MNVDRAARIPMLIAFAAMIVAAGTACSPDEENPTTFGINIEPYSTNTSERVTDTDESSTGIHESVSHADDGVESTGERVTNPAESVSNADGITTHNHVGDPNDKVGNVLGFSSALLCSKYVLLDNGGYESHLLAVENPGDCAGVNTAACSLDLVRPGVIRGIGFNSSGHLLLLKDVFIEVFDTAESIAENAPSRTVHLSGVMGRAWTMAFDPDRSTLYVVGQAFSEDGLVLAFEDTASAAFDGFATPTRTITAPILSTARAFTDAFVSQDDQLYLRAANITGVGGDPAAIVAFEHASSLGVGGAPAVHDRLIEFPEFDAIMSDLGQFAIDADDNLLIYAALETGPAGSRRLDHGIISVPNASVADGEISQPHFICFEAPSEMVGGGMVVDPQGTVYFSCFNDTPGGETGVAVFESVAGRSGEAAPDRTFDIRGEWAGGTLASEVMYLLH